MKRRKLSAEILREQMTYDPKTGHFTRKIKTSHNASTTKPAGCRRDDGYIIISIHNRNYYGHHLAWLYMTGEWPSKIIDHKNCNPSDNSWLNLREASHSGNHINTPLQPNNTSGIRGVVWDKTRSKWAARIKHNGRTINLGRFESKEEAGAAYLNKAKELHGDFVPLGPMGALLDMIASEEAQLARAVGDLG